MDNYILDDLKHYVIDHLLYKSGNKVVDDFISNAQINTIHNNLEADIMEFIPYDQFKDIKFINNFKSYKATWIEGNIQSWKKINFKRSGAMRVVLKKLNNSENITSKELNEVPYILI